MRPPHEVSTLDLNEPAVQMDLTDNASRRLHHCEALVQLPDGSTQRKSQKYRNMTQAVNDCTRFLTELPYGSRLLRAEFTNARGEGRLPICRLTWALAPGACAQYFVLSERGRYRMRCRPRFFLQFH